MSLSCHWMSREFPLFFFEFADQPIPKTLSVIFLVWAYREQCVHLTRDNIIEQYINTFPETPRPNLTQTASHCCFEKFRIKRYPNRPSLDYPLDLTKSTNQKIRKRKDCQKKLDIKIKKTANSDDLLGNMQLKLSFHDWCISILSSKKCQTSIILADLLGNESFLQRVQKVIVYGLWLVDFDPFFEFLCFKVRCLWSYCDQNPTLIFQIFLIDFIPGLQTSKFRWGKNTEDSD